MLLVLAIVAMIVSCSDGGPSEPEPPVTPTLPDPVLPAPELPQPVVPTTVGVGTVASGTIGAGVDSVKGYRIGWENNVTRYFSLQATSGALTDTLTATLFQLPESTFIATVVSAGTQGDLRDDRLSLPRHTSPAAHLLVHVRGLRAGHDGPFNLLLEGPSEQPESVDPAFAINDTVIGESLDDRTEIDRFVFAGTPGQEVILFKSIGLPDVIGTEVFFTVIDAQEDTLSHQTWGRGLRSLEERAQRFTLSDHGPYTVIVRGDRFNLWEGPYSFWVYPIDPAPESASPTFAPGDTINESIDAVGDVDEFTLAAVQGQELHITFAVPDVKAGELRLQVFDGDTAVADLRSAGGQTSLDDLGSARWTVPATGDYRLLLSSPWQGVKGTLVGPYQIEAYLVHRAPETLAAAGHSVPLDLSGESLERRWDIDEFLVDLTAGTQYKAVGAMERTAGGDQISIAVLTPAGATITGSSTESYAEATDSAATGRFAAAVTAAHIFRVEGDSPNALPFRVHARSIDLAPESVPAAIALNTWVEGEALDILGDIDEFTFMATAGLDYNLVIEPIGHASPYIGVSAGIGAGLLARTNGFASGLGVAAATGPVVARVSEFPDNVDVAGGYRFAVYEISRAPETASAALTIGDAITGESIDVPGDIDEFVFSGVAGDALRLTFDRSPTGGPSFGYVIRHEGSGAVISAGGNGTFDFTLQFPGEFRIRVNSSPTLPSQVGAYTLSLTRQ